MGVYTLVSPYNKFCRPLSGMDYITEFQKDDANEEPRYVCEMCQSKMDQRQVILHLVGFKHRMKYFVSTPPTLLGITVQRLFFLVSILLVYHRV